jgi:hypothetical protein
MKPTILKIGAVFSSLALASSFVWYQAGGKARLMPKSSVPIAPTETDPMAHRADYNAESAVVTFPADSKLSPTEKEELRRALLSGSKSGGIFTPDDAPIAAKTTLAPARDGQTTIHTFTEPEGDVYINGGGPTNLTEEQKQVAEKARKELVRAVKEEMDRKVLMFSSKDGKVFEPGDIPEKSQKQDPYPQPPPVMRMQAGPSQQRSSAPSTSATSQPTPRRAIMSGSKSMVINLERLPANPNTPAQNPPKQQQQPQQRRVLMPGSKSEIIRD